MITLFLLIPFIIYLFTLLFFCLANLKLQSHQITTDTNLGISVIIAIRNGEKSLNHLIQNLLLQNYKGPIEFILIDDESTDNTKKYILDIVNKDCRFKYLSSLDGNNKLKFKKKALDLGIQNSKYNHLLFTDVDCSISSNWITMMAHYFSNGFEYLVGYSLVKRNNKLNIVSKFQKMDLLLLMIMCRGSSYLSAPWASSGQNQGFTKDLYNRTGGFLKITKFLGDDTPFLQHCIAQGANVSFIDSPNPQILSRQEFKVSNFLFQRARWVFDANQIWRINIIFFILLVMTFIFYLMIPFLFFTIPTNIIFWLIIFKLLLEFSLFNIGAKKYSEKIDYIDFLIWQILHIPYIILVGTMSFFKNQIQWKGRNLTI